MTDLAFDTLTLERRIAASPARVFALMTDREARQTWGSPEDGVVVVIDDFDLRPGGRELARCGPAENPEFFTVSTFHAVEAPRHLICTESLTVGGDLVSVGLITQALAPDGDGTHLTVTIQVTSVTGPDTAADYRTGWSSALDNLATMAAKGVPA